MLETVETKDEVCVAECVLVVKKGDCDSTAEADG